MNVTGNIQSCAQVNDNCYDKDQVKEPLYGSHGHGLTRVMLALHPQCTNYCTNDSLGIKNTTLNKCEPRQGRKGRIYFTVVF